MTEIPFAASVALIDKGKVLLIQRARAPYFGLWTLPGGRLEPGEDAETCAVREVEEELGLRVYALRPVLQMQVGEAERHLLAVFGTEAFDGEIVASEEITDYRWLRPQALGTLQTTPHLPEVLEGTFRLFDRS